MLFRSIPDSRLTGHPKHRLPHHASFVFQIDQGESIVQALDMAGIAASSGAACDQGELEPSSVLEAMGFSPHWGVGSLRLTLGRSSDGEDVSRVLEVLPGIIERLRG